METLQKRTSSEVQTIEQTSKKWKLLKLIGTLVMLAGMPGCIMVLTGNSSHLVPYIFMAGALVYTVGGLGAWWHHS